MKRTTTVQTDERKVLGPHKDGGYRVSSSDGITEYRVHLDGRTLRCTCPRYTHQHKCPHLYPVAVRLGIATAPRETRRTVGGNGVELWKNDGEQAQREPLSENKLVRLFG